MTPNGARFALKFSSVTVTVVGFVCLAVSIVLSMLITSSR